jgi:hypothetical protein
MQISKDQKIPHGNYHLEVAGSSWGEVVANHPDQIDKMIIQ